MKGSRRTKPRTSTKPKPVRRKNSTLPYRKDYAADEMAETVCLDLAARGAYRSIRLALWMAGGWLPHDTRTIARAASIDSSEWNQVWPCIRHLFVIDEDRERVYHERDAEAMASALNEQANRRRGADATNAKRYGTQSEPAQGGNGGVTEVAETRGHRARRARDGGKQGAAKTGTSSLSDTLSDTLSDSQELSQERSHEGSQIQKPRSPEAQNPSSPSGSQGRSRAADVAAVPQTQTTGEEDQGVSPPASGPEPDTAPASEPATPPADEGRPPARLALVKEPPPAIGYDDTLAVMVPKLRALGKTPAEVFSSVVIRRETGNYPHLAKWGDDAELEATVAHLCEGRAAS